MKKLFSLISAKFRKPSRETQEPMPQYEIRDVSMDEAMDMLLEKEERQEAAEAAVTLDQDFVLSFESISHSMGHMGSQVSYKAATREAVYEMWGTHETGKRLPNGEKELRSKEESERIPVPETVANKAQLRAYIRRNTSWPLR